LARFGDFSIDAYWLRRRIFSKCLRNAIHSKTCTYGPGGNLADWDAAKKNIKSQLLISVPVANQGGCFISGRIVPAPWLFGSDAISNQFNSIQFKPEPLGIN
jgi:hypothetical protein